VNILSKFSKPKFKYDDSVPGIVEPPPGFAKKHDLLLAQVLAQPRDNMVPVPVINLSPNPVTLYQNTSVGTFSQLEDGALGPVCSNGLATKMWRQTKLLV